MCILLYNNIFNLSQEAADAFIPKSRRGRPAKDRALTSGDGRVAPERGCS